MADDAQVSKLGIASAVLKAVLSASARMWTSPFKGENGAPNYYKDVIFAMSRAQLGGLDLAQDRFMSTPTTTTYLNFAKAKGFTPESITLPSGTQAHWIGSKDAKKVILWFHGGGYVMPATAQHMQWLYDLKDELIAENSDAAALILAYDVAPEQKYPTQLGQAIETIRYLVEIEGRSPSAITIGGDSAGGNLAIGVMAHLAHPHPNIPALTLPAKLHAAILISPWVSFNTNTPAYKTNAEKDMFDARPLIRWSTAFLGTDAPYAGDFYNEPVLAPANFWEEVSHVIDEVLVWGGANEILVDGIREFAKRFTEGFGGKGGKVTTVITSKAAHIEPIAERIVGYKGDSGSGSQIIIMDWVKARL